MRSMWLRISVIALVAITAYLYLLTTQGLNSFEYATVSIPDSLVPIEGEISRPVSSTLWNARYLDVIVLSLLLFVTSACCASLLHSEKAIVS
jgi:hypothetical protein